MLGLSCDLVHELQTDLHPVELPVHLENRYFAPVLMRRRLPGRRERLDVQENNIRRGPRMQSRHN